MLETEIWRPVYPFQNPESGAWLRFCSSWCRNRTLILRGVIIPGLSSIYSRPGRCNRLYPLPNALDFAIVIQVSCWHGNQTLTIEQNSLLWSSEAIHSTRIPGFSSIALVTSLGWAVEFFREPPGGMCCFLVVNFVRLASPHNLRSSFSLWSLSVVSKECLWTPLEVILNVSAGKVSN